MSNFQKEDGTGTTPPPNGAAAGAVTSNSATRRQPRQGLKTDINRHGIRRELNTNPRPPKKTGRKKI